MMGEESDNLHAANTMMTNDDVFIRIVKHGQALWDISHWNQFAAINMTDIKLPGFPDVYQAGVVGFKVFGKLPGIEPLYHSCTDPLQIRYVGFEQPFADPLVMTDTSNQHRVFGGGIAGYGKQAAIDRQCVLEVLRDVF